MIKQGRKGEVLVMVVWEGGLIFNIQILLLRLLMRGKVQ